jgi:hypothetical protein
VKNVKCREEERSSEGIERKTEGEIVKAARNEAGETLKG